MPPSRRSGSAKGKPRKRGAPSIRDAAASAAAAPGSGSRSPAQSSASRKRSTSGRPARPAPGVDEGVRRPRRRPEPGEGEEGARPQFPDFETAAPGWDPWDEPGASASAGAGGFDPQRTLGDWLEAVIPPQAQVHFIRAGQEFAAGIQTTVDHHLGRGSRAAAGPDGASRIEIE